MDKELSELLELARFGQPDPYQRLVEMLRRLSKDDPAILIEFAKSTDELQRRAAISAASGRTEPELLDALASLAKDANPFVRQCLAYSLTDFPGWPMDAAVEALLNDADGNVRQSAIWAAKPRSALTPALVKRLPLEPNNWVRCDLANALADCDARVALPALLTRLAEDADQSVQQSCAYAVEKHIGALGTYPSDVPRPGLKVLGNIRRRLTGFTNVSCPNLLAWLNEQLVAHVDLEQLAGFGTVLSLEAEKGELPHGYMADEPIATILNILDGPPPHAVVLTGESGSGKTAVVQELTYRLLTDPDKPGYVLRMAPQDFLAGTKYIGEWETKVRNVIAAVKPPRRIILYIPNVEELAWMGTWEKSDASVASALAPYLERGDLTILGESTTENFRKGLGANRSLRRLFHVVELQPSDARDTRAILRSVAQEAGAVIAEGVLDRLDELADYFVSGSVQPGRSVGLLRRVLGMIAGKKTTITEQDILGTISTSTGIPVQFLDDGVALNRTAVRDFFEARVMGQPEAVEAVVDLVTLVKAGLTDPNKPFGVFLFVGPTGVGKTELARALAEHLFSDTGRLVRLDMSEFATYEAFERLIGGARGAEPGLLTATVRERPFSVLLFDEIEKAHPNIFNLCLQIFDAGRLTDTQGRTADFRRTIIIMTSNVGSSIASEAPVGFGRQATPAPERDTVMRELGRWFRPEFLNRLDRIVTFRPLAVETAEKIAQREVGRVLERGGIARRNLAVDVDPAVLPLLLREGYSPAFGARPLKRTIERLVLLPVARAIAEGKVPAGSLLRLVANRNRVDIEVEPPEPTEAPTPPAARAVPIAQRAAELSQKVQDILQNSAPLAARKSTLLTQSTAPGFWDNAAASRTLFDEVYRLDGILGGLEELKNKVKAEVDLAQRQRHSDRDLARIEERLDGLESQSGHLAFLVGCQDPQALGDAIVTLRLTARQGKSLEGVVTLARMYQNLASRRGLETQVFSDHFRADSRADSISLVVSGAGAFALFAGEGGLHHLSKGRKQEGKGSTQRESIGVEVLPFPAKAVTFATEEIQVEVKSLDAKKGRLLAKLNHEVRLFHAPTMTSVHGWCDGSKTEAIDNLKTLLRARLDVPEPARKPPVVRRYRLGPTTLVRDQRTGRSTGRLDQVLEGHLDMFLTAMG